MSEIHHRSCNLCEAMCGIRIEHEGKKILSIKGDPDDKFSQGYICPKATALEDLYTDPDRLVRPLKKRGNDFEEISWETAFDEVTEKVKALQQKHGRSALAVYQGNPNVHSLGAMTYGQLFTRGLRTRSHYSATSMDQLPHQLASYLMFGNQFLIPVPDLDNTRTMIIVGANPLASNGSIMTAPGMKRRLREIKERGGRVVVIDPRRTETALAADQHFFIRPGADAALLAAMVKILVDDPQLGRLAAFTDGLAQVKEAVKGVDIDKVAVLTGIAANDIRALAHSLVKDAPAVIYGRMGACTQDFGGLTAWLLLVLNAISGNLDRAGGAMITSPAIDVAVLMGKAGAGGHFGKRKSRVRGLPEFAGEWPVSCLAEGIEVAGDGQIKGLFTVAGNPVLSSPQGSRLDRVLPSLELMVSIDPYVNETTRHAHYILPPTSPLEREHYDLIFHALAVRNTARYSDALFEKPKDARHDWQIFLELSKRLSHSGAQRVGLGIWQALSGARGPRPIVDVMLRLGKHRLSVKKLRAHPHGLDLGALEPRFPEALQSKDRRIDLAPKQYLDDLPRLLTRINGVEKDGLVLIGRRDLRSNNSWMHNSERLIKGADRCTLLMHPDDAKSRGLTTAASVNVSSRVGEVTVNLEVTDAIMPGVVSLPHGFGHGRSGVRLKNAVAHAGVSINDLTDTERVDPLSGNASFNGTPVSVRPA